MALMYSEAILKELETSLSMVKEEELYKVLELIQKNRRIFCDGLGRSGLVSKAFAMRLMHLGFMSMCVGEISATAIGQDDLYLVCSGSGESEALISHARKAKKMGARVALVTSNRNSTLGLISDACIEIKANKKDEVIDGLRFVLPMGTLFEGVAAIVFENLVLMLMEQLGETSQTMFKRHANLE